LLFQPVDCRGARAAALARDQVEHTAAASVLEAVPLPAALAGDGDAERAVVAVAQRVLGGERLVGRAEQIEGDRANQAGEVCGVEIAPRAGTRLPQFS
jgi:hypothetical protein